MNHSSSQNLPSLGIRSLRYASVESVGVQSESKTLLYKFQITRNLRQSPENVEDSVPAFPQSIYPFFAPFCRLQSIDTHARTRPLSFFLAPWQQISIFIPLNLIHRGRGRGGDRPSERGDRQHAKRQLTPSKRRFARPRPPAKKEEKKKMCSLPQNEGTAAAGLRRRDVIYAHRDSGDGEQDQIERTASRRPSETKEMTVRALLRSGCCEM